MITEFIKNQYLSIKELFYIWNGADMHFKNKYNVTNLSFHKIDFDLLAEWIFTATDHGKSACDGKIVRYF